MVDTLGLLLGVTVTAADVGDRTAAQVLLARVAAEHHRLALVRADGGCTGSLVEHCLAAFALVLAIVRCSDDMRGFVVLPRRWIVGRLFALLTRSRRLARDYERCTAIAEAMILWSMTVVMTLRLAQDRADAGRAEPAVLPQPAHPVLHWHRGAVRPAGTVQQPGLVLTAPAADPLVGRGPRGAPLGGHMSDRTAERTRSTSNRLP